MPTRPTASATRLGVSFARRTQSSVLISNDAVSPGAINISPLMRRRSAAAHVSSANGVTSAPNE